MQTQYTCESCAATFIRDESRRRIHHFCSRSCANTQPRISRRARNESVFWSKADVAAAPYPDLDPCWMYPRQYAWHIGVQYVSSRLAWFYVYGSLPTLHVLHHCDRGWNGGKQATCINPSHLYEGTDADNNRDMVSRGRAVYLSGEALVTARTRNAKRRNV